MNVAEGIAGALADADVSHFFGLVGSGNFVVTTALAQAGTHFVPARHECGAVAMADGYARASGKLGVATVHQGPGLTNAMTSIAEAAKARTPLLVLAADTSAGAVRSNFRIDQGALVSSVGAIPERIHSPESALYDLQRAWKTAVAGRRTVVVNMPLDVQTGELLSEPRFEKGVETAPMAPARRSVERVADLVARSERPVIIAGRGAVISGAREDIGKLAELIGALLATSANGNGLFATNPWSIGISGGFSTPTAARLLREADLVLSFGASLNMWTTRHGTLIDAKTSTVAIDVERDAIGAHSHVDEALLADAGEAARALVEELQQRGFRGSGYRSDETRAAIVNGAWRFEAFEDGSAPDSIDPRTLSAWLDRTLPEDRTLAIDSGHFMGWPAMYLSVPDEHGFVFCQSFQSVGLGLATAIGASVARPDRLTVACLGDGGALMAAGEFETIARLNLRIVVVIYNDSAYGAEVHHFRPGGHDLGVVRFPDTDFAALARAFGAQGITVRNEGDLPQLARVLNERVEPIVVDAKVAPDVVAEWLEEAFRSH